MAEKTAQFFFLGIGLLMALAGGALKLPAALAEPEVFSFIFFSGDSYLLLPGGLALVALAIGHDLFFGPEGPTE